jgi:hypothetical protein
MFSWGGPWSPPDILILSANSLGGKPFVSSMKKLVSPMFLLTPTWSQPAQTFGYGSTPKIGLLITGWCFQTGRIVHNIWYNPSHWRSYFSRLLLHHLNQMISFMILTSGVPALNFWPIQHVESFRRSELSLAYVRKPSPIVDGIAGCNGATPLYISVAWCEE